MYARLTEEYRGELLECAHEGLICGVGIDGVKYALGDPAQAIFYRSTLKPIQILPFLWNALDKKYGLTEEEIVIMSASQQCEWTHLEVIKSLLKKAEINEDDLIMQPTYPSHQKTRYEMIQKGMEPRKIYHECIGKHIACMLLMREKGEDERKYGHPGSYVQQTILDYISEISDYPKEKIAIGIDGCGVPVFAIPIERIALSYLRLAKPELLKNTRLAELIRRNTALMNKHGRLIAAEGTLDDILLKDPNIIAKFGAQGIFCFALRDEELGFTCKCMDGTFDPLPIVAISILERIRYKNQDTIDKLKSRFSSEYKNKYGIIVTTHNAVFDLGEE